MEWIGMKKMITTTQVETSFNNIEKSSDRERII